MPLGGWNLCSCHQRPVGIRVICNTCSLSAVYTCGVQKLLSKLEAQSACSCVRLCLLGKRVELAWFMHGDAGLDVQPRWARALLRPQASEPDLDVSTITGYRPAGQLRSRADIVQSVHLSRGGGLLVDEDFIRCYPEARRDVESLINEGTVRHVRRLLEDTVVSRASDWPIGTVLYPRFDAEAEGMKVDLDICEAYHSIDPPQILDSGARIAPRLDEAPQKRPRRVSQRSSRVQNTHMTK